MKLKVVKFGHTLKVSENCKEIPVNKYNAVYAFLEVMFDQKGWLENGGYSLHSSRSCKAY